MIHILGFVLNCVVCIPFKMTMILWSFHGKDHFYFSMSCCNLYSLLKIYLYHKLQHVLIAYLKYFLQWPVLLYRLVVISDSRYRVVLQGYAYILTHPGIPSVFYDHFYDWGDSIHDQIVKLVWWLRAELVFVQLYNWSFEKTSFR